MTQLLRAIEWVRGLSRTTQLVILSVALLTGAVKALLVWDHHRLTMEFEHGRQSVIRAAKAPDSASVARVTAASDRAAHATDRVVTVVKWRAAVADTQAIVATALAARVPDSLRAVPVIDSLVTLVPKLSFTITSLRGDVERVVDTLHVERIARAAERDTLTADLHDARVITIAQSDTIAVLQKRPRWSTVAKVGTTTLGVGVAIGEWVLPKILGGKR